VGADPTRPTALLLSGIVKNWETAIRELELGWSHSDENLHTRIKIIMFDTLWVEALNRSSQDMNSTNLVIIPVSATP
jgi:hypothetical protein